MPISQPDNPQLIIELESQGYVLLPNALDKAAIEELLQHIQPSLENPAVSHRQSQTFAIRNLLNVIPKIRAFAGSPMIRHRVEPILGAEARVTRGIFFDKVPMANWKVSWHQDVTITVREKKEIDGFSAWTLKAGIPHVQPPVTILENILTLRVHLDDADETNGALKVIPGSHQHGRMSDAEIQAFSQESPHQSCCVKQGDILMMRPLLLHASSSGESPHHRRVIHLEFSADRLPNGLDWFGS